MHALLNLGREVYSERSRRESLHRL